MELAKKRWVTALLRVKSSRLMLELLSETVRTPRYIVSKERRKQKKKEERRTIGHFCTLFFLLSFDILTDVLTLAGFVRRFSVRICAF